MRSVLRVALWVTLFLGVAVGAAPAGEQPQPPANDDCLACHGESTAKRANETPVFVDQKTFEQSTHSPMACVDCHTDLAKLAEYPHADALAKVRCATCHDDISSKYHDSIHARARERAGLIVAPGCADCHGSHDIKAHTDTASRVYRATIPATCTKCHAGIKPHYDAGIHAAALKQGNPRAPVCIDCHTAHAIQRADTETWRLSVTRECGTCHTEVVDSFLRTFHGKVTELGFTRVAACADCHGAHDILPASNPASMISPARLVSTCQKCHAGANERFVQYDPHPNPHNYARSPLLWWINKFYVVLITGCFSFFGLHSLLWFRRARKEQRPQRGGHP